ncbi:hypothetical protein GGR42_001296 [Saonia flava]|uniref:Uncharacterized protein n=1 Tax=Saonia flava TaxID=523696 RepID=A0A846R0E1_9FLAO|nr:hypothetical protein [Saonia flava]NJB70834.1 hypothetical protein [Saonia flava]
MFVGHYAAAFVLKGKEKNASLGMLFLATQFVDILFFPLVVLGLEKLTFIDRYTAVNDFKMEFPYTHGLLASMLWAGLIYALYYFVFAKKKETKKRIALIMGLAVLSHWFADLLVHTPDLPLIYGEPKVGLGLWNNKILTFALEAILLAAGLWYYLKKTKPTSNIGKYIAIIFVVFLLLVNYLNLFVLPANHNVIALTISALASYFVLAAIAHYVDLKRI